MTKEEISQWIRKTGQIEDPYIGKNAPRFRLQFHAPEKYGTIECFVRCFLSEAVAGGDILMVVVDSEPSEDSQRYIHEAMRFFHGEKRSVEVAPGYLVGVEETEKAIALFTLTSCFGWKSYLYGSNEQVVLHNWEGEIFDVWTRSDERKRVVESILKNFKLKEVTEL